MRRAAAALAVLLALAALPLSAQVTRMERIDPRERARQDSLRAAQDTTRRDTTKARGGIPKTPSRSFPAADSILEALKARRGFNVTRYSADSVQLLAGEKEVRLAGQALIERDGSTLEADTIRYTETNCVVVAAGSPRLFDPTGVMIGEGMRYDACNHAGIVSSARTDLVHGGGTWYLQGDMAVDNEEDRVYAAHASITSCELVDPHYHFAAREVKWVNKRLMVSRPAVLYVADVPIAWLPFVFQDTRRGRRSGILAPQFGINDIVRFNPGYSRHIANVGYYWAFSDRTDAQLSGDWYAGQFWSISGRFRYRILDRFMAGGLSYQTMHQSGGASSQRIALSHQQDFSLTTHLTADLDYTTSSSIISRNAVDPILAIGTIDSRLNYQRRFAGGNLNLGGSRTQSLDRPQVTATFPTVAFTPAPIAVSRLITWSPSFSFTNSVLQHGTPTAVLLGSGQVDSVFAANRRSNLDVSTPLRIGQWNLSNAVRVTDGWDNTRSSFTDTTTGVITTRGENFQTDFDWTTGVGLPALFQGRWNLAPSINMVNTAAGAFMIRNSYTSGSFVSQSKRFQFALSAAPTIFGLFPGFGPVTRIRHAFSPQVAWAYSPAADIPAEYARATNRGQLPATLTRPPTQTLSFALSQNFEAKLRPPRTPATAARAAADTAAPTESAEQAPEGRKIKLLSIASGTLMGYDFEQAKLPGRTGWTTSSWSNTISSDLIRGLSVSLVHDLWDGPVGYAGSRFAPALTSVTTGFSISGSTLNLFRRLLGLTPGRVTDIPDSANAARDPTDAGSHFDNATQRGLNASQYSRADRLSPARGGGAFQAQFNYNLSRQRAVTVGANPTPAKTATSMVGGTVQFSPTSHWTVSWQTSYNFVQGEFSDHTIRLDRDLHDWRATFMFIKSPNGNFLFNFSIALIAEPDLKFDYDQRNVR